MWTKFKSFPLSVQAAIVFLTVTVTSAIVMMPAVMVPLFIIFGLVASVIRVLAFFIHGE